MSNLNSWEDDPSAQDENLARRAQQQLNVNPGQAQGQGQGGFRPSIASFQPGAQSFQPGQQYGGGYANQYQQQQQQQQYYQQGYYPQYGQQQQGLNQYNQGGVGGGFSQGYNQGYGTQSLPAFPFVHVNQSNCIFKQEDIPNTANSKVRRTSKPHRLPSPVPLPPHQSSLLLRPLPRRPPPRF
jgi:peptide chain release factor subunit 3